MTKLFVVNAKEWFDKLYWNSYFWLQIKELQDGKLVEIHNSFCNYWYGNHYQDVARAELRKLGKLKVLQEYSYGGYEYDFSDTSIDYNITQVTRKKDMKF